MYVFNMLIFRLQPTRMDHSSPCLGQAAPPSVNFLIDESTLKATDDKLGQYVDKAEPKGNMFILCQNMYPSGFGEGSPRCIANKYGWLEPAAKIRL